MPLAVRIAHGTMAALFALSALLQLNDPNPLAWIVIYLLASIATFLTTFKRWLHAQIAGGVVLAVALISEIPYIRAKAWQTPFGDLTKEWKMTSEAIVDGREFYALLWILVWMIVVVVSSRKALRNSPQPTS